jgi:hypothetical protein
MSEAVPSSRQEFWLRPGIAATLPTAASNGESLKSCVHCATEFMAGSRFCYLCGAKREMEAAPKPWVRHHSFSQLIGIRYLQQRLGLSIPALCAFLAGIGCLIEAVRAGFVFRAETLADFQALQLVRIEWLLGAVAAFVAGVVVKDAGFRK